MPNRQLIDDWNRTQARYPQARYFTPGRQETQYQRLEKGAPQQMNLLVVVHNDAPSAGQGMRRVDVIVDSGRYDQKAARANGHLVNTYDEEAGVTDHTALYTDQQMGLISAHSGPNSVRLQDRPEGGPPGATIYSVRAQLRENEHGQLVIDTDAPMRPGPGASRYSLHDVQGGMNLAAEPPAYGPPAAPARPVTAPPPPSFAEQQRSAPRQVPEGFAGQTAIARNSQAGLATHGGPKRSLPSVPRPGEPGSRFNPTMNAGEPGSRFNPRVRERQAQPLGQPADPSKLIQVPDFPSAGAAPAPATPLPASKPLGQAAMQKKLVDRLGELPASKDDSAGKTVAKAALSGVVRGVRAELAVQAEVRGKDRVDVAGTPDLSSRLSEMAQVTEQSAPVAAKPSVRDTYDYQFETPDSPDTSGPEYEG